MVNFFKILIFSLLLTSCTVTDGEAESAERIRSSSVTANVTTTSIEVVNFPTSSLSVQESRVRKAAVKVITEYGHGSGTYMMLNGFPIVVTAAHVIDDPSNMFYKVGGVDGEIVDATRVYFDEKIDVGVLLLNSKMQTREHILYQKSKKISGIGTRLVYSGYPSSHGLLTIRGMVAGYGAHYGNTVVLMHGYGWFGCSGSGIFDDVGNFVGVLWGVDIEGVAGLPQVVEDIIWITPSKDIDHNAVLKGACMTSGSTKRVCRKYIK